VLTLTNIHLQQHRCHPSSNSSSSSWSGQQLVRKLFSAQTCVQQVAVSGAAVPQQHSPMVSAAVHRLGTQEVRPLCHPPAPRPCLLPAPHTRPGAPPFELEIPRFDSHIRLSIEQGQGVATVTLPPPPTTTTTHTHTHSHTHTEGDADTAPCRALMSSLMPCPRLACPLPLCYWNPQLLYYVCILVL
jgi:hypothetical protein